MQSRCRVDAERQKRYSPGAADALIERSSRGTCKADSDSNFKADTVQDRHRADGAARGSPAIPEQAASGRSSGAPSSIIN